MVYRQWPRWNFHWIARWLLSAVFFFSFLSFAHAMRRALGNNNNEWPTQHFFTENINQMNENSDVEWKTTHNKPIGYCYTNNKLSAATKEPTKLKRHAICYLPISTNLFFLADLLACAYSFRIYLFDLGGKNCARDAVSECYRDAVRFNGSSSSSNT